MAIDTTLAVAFSAIAFSISVAALSYHLTKKQEREASWRQQKLPYYMAFMESYSGIVQGDDTPEAHRAFANASNNLMLFAPKPVLEALYAFRHENRATNPTPDFPKIEMLFKKLILEIRNDIGIVPQANFANFEIQLWASGTNKH